MGSIANPTKKLDTLLPKPPKENLCSHFILGEIIDHIDIIHRDFPDVNVPLLKSHLWDIRNKTVNPEVHLRGFLKVFQETSVFKEAFGQLDDSMKVQIKTFIAGGGEEVVLAAGRKGNTFSLPPSPPVKHHFKGLTKKVDKLFHHEEHAHAANGINGIANGHVKKVAETVEEKVEKVKDFLNHVKEAHAVNGGAVNGDAVNGVVNGHVENLISSTAGYPRIFEDKGETKTMEVGHQSRILSHLKRNVAKKRHSVLLLSPLEACFLGL
jgi:hypothetical protein